MRIESARILIDSMPLVLLTVEGGAANMDADLETWKPCRYEYDCRIEFCVRRM